MQILSKRNDGFHNISSIFYPIDFHEGIEAIEDPTLNKGKADLSITGLNVTGPIFNNSVYKAFQVLQRHHPQIPSLQIHLHKKIPLGAGLGGGSSDAAYTLKLLNNLLGLNLTSKQLHDYALELGSDCPFFINSKPSFVQGRGEQLEEIELDLSAHKIALVYPGIHVDTTWAFSTIKPIAGRTPLNQLISLPIKEWKNAIINDFEIPVFKKYPEIASLKQELYKLGAQYSSLSGSGSVVYGIFENTPTFNLPSSYLLKII